MKSLDGFLGDESGQAEAVEPSAAVELPNTGETEAPPQPVTQPTEPAIAEDGEPPAPEDVDGLKRALQATRKERKDYKGESAEWKGKYEALTKELEEQRKLPPAPPAPVAPPAAREPQQIPPPPNPAEDPAGFAQWQRMQDANERALVSEHLLRKEMGNADVDAKLAIFLQAQAADPWLQKAVLVHPDPYRFAVEHATKIEKQQQEQERIKAAMAEIGPDPEAWKAKAIADARASWEAEYAAQGQSAPRVSLPTSLGTARSAAPRGEAASVPVDFDDILRRKR